MTIAKCIWSSSLSTAVHKPPSLTKLADKYDSHQLVHPFTLIPWSPSKSFHHEPCSNVCLQSNACASIAAHALLRNQCCARVAVQQLAFTTMPAMKEFATTMPAQQCLRNNACTAMPVQALLRKHCCASVAAQALLRKRCCASVAALMSLH